MTQWSLLTLVGEDRPGIVAAVSRALFEGGCHLAEASMMRLGGNFAIMLRVAHAKDSDLKGLLFPVCQSLGLHLHIDVDIPATAPVVEPDVQVTVYGVDRPGIVAQVTGVLAEAGLNIVDLETAVGGSEDNPIYIMTIEGVAEKGVERLEEAVASLDEGIKVKVTSIETMRG